MTCGIYKLNFTGTDKVYVGQSLNIENRYTKHLNKMRKQDSSIRLNEAYSMYGEPSIQILHTCTPPELDKLEVEEIARYNAITNGFNAYDTVNSSGGSPLPGELNGNSKYTDNQIVQVFVSLLDPTKTYVDISKNTGVSVNVISKVSTGSSHTWLEEKYPEKYKKLISIRGTRAKGELAQNSVYSNDTIIEIFKAIVNNPSYTQQEISDLTEIPRSVIMSICACSKYKWLEDMFPSMYADLKSRIGNRKEIKDSFKETRKIVSPLGDIYEVTNIRNFAIQNNLDPGALGKVLRGNIPHHKNWRKYVE